MKKHLFHLLAVGLIFLTGCMKEVSFETSSKPSHGSLQAELSGDCLPKTVNGTYVATTPLVATTNTITVQVNVTTTGAYTIYTDTINNMFFRATGIFTTIGANTVTLRGNGTPFQSNTWNFVVNYDSTFCDVQVDVLPAGAGGPATFALLCPSVAVSGTYVKDAAVNASNYIDVDVDVSAIGTYSITASGGGMTFTKSGAFLNTGVQTIRLQATGTPNTVGSNTITFAAPLASCSFTVTVTGPASYTIDCPNVVVNGTYQVGVALNPVTNTIDIPINVITAGAYSITATINGMTFSGSGTVAVGPTTITIAGTASSIPTTQGVNNLVITNPPNPSCTVPITVAAAPTIDWKFNIGTTLFQGSTFDVTYDNTTFPPITFFVYFGDNAAPDDINIALTDIAGGITNNEQYNTTSSGLTNAAGFFFTNGAGTLDLSAVPMSGHGESIIFRITSHITATKTIIGTFSGTAWDNVSSSLKTITNGQFTAIYP